MVMEYWTGWFDSWGGPHNILDASGECFVVPPSSVVADLTSRIKSHITCCCGARLLGLFAYNIQL